MSPLALTLVLCAAVAHAGWNILAHGVSRIGMPFLWWGAVASSVLWVGVVPLTGGLGTDDLSGFALGIVVSGILHVGYMFVLQRGYAAGSLSTVYATARGTGPAISSIAAVLLLGERPSPLALVGGAVIGLLTGVAIAAYTIWDAHAIRAWNLSPVAFMVGVTIVEVPFYTIALGRRIREVPGVLRNHWPRILAFGALSPLSYILVLQAITIAPVALVAPMREVSVVIVSLFGALVLKEARPGWRVAAAIVVVGGIALLAI